jgi:hypothetical protein
MTDHVPTDLARKLHDHLTFLYGDEAGKGAWAGLQTRLERFRRYHPELRREVPPPDERLTEKDAVLITYGDQVQEEGKAPLASLREVLVAHAGEIISFVHLLPFFSINREKFQRAELEAALSHPDSLRSRVFSAYGELLRARRPRSAFHPNAPQRVLDLHPALFALERAARDGASSLLCLHSVAGETLTIPLPVGGTVLQDAARLRDVVGGATFPVEGGAVILELPSYAVLWLEAAE